MRRGLLVLIVFGVLAGSAQAKDLKPAQIVDRLNKERAAVGMEPVKLSSTYTKGCKLHNRWEQLNNTIGHDEQSGTRGYTSLGDKTAGLSVLAFGTGGWAKGNPWRNGPFHLMLVYEPRLRSVGAYDSYNRSCLETNAGIAAPSAAPEDRIYTSPGDGRSAPYLQWALESPYTPQELIGLSANSKTGPNLLVWADSMDPSDEFARIVSASLVESGGGGSVKIGTIDQRHSRGELAHDEGVIVPRKPLKKKTTYQATIVMATAAGRKATHVWSFKTTSAKLTD